MIGHHPLALAGLSVCVLSVAGCKSLTVQQHEPPVVARWINPDAFPGMSADDTYVSVSFDIEFTDTEGQTIRVERCWDQSSFADGDLTGREYTRWDGLRVDCQGLERYDMAPATSVSYWPADFDLALIESFPATALPYLGPQGLDGRTGQLGSFPPGLELLDATPLSVKVRTDGMVVDYVSLARGDFNRDGVEDLFVRMDWYIEDAFGRGSSWVAVTRTGKNEAPMLLWRK